jgi:hypothetical protein
MTTNNGSNIPNNAPDVDVLARLVVCEHIALQRRSHPECPILNARLVCVQQRRIALCNRDSNPRNLGGRKQRPVSLDEREGVIVNREAN